MTCTTAASPEPTRNRLTSRLDRLPCRRTPSIDQIRAEAAVRVKAAAEAKAFELHVELVLSK